MGTSVCSTVPPECLSETSHGVGQYSVDPSVFVVQGDRRGGISISEILLWAVSDGK